MSTKQSADRTVDANCSTVGLSAWRLRSPKARGPRSEAPLLPDGLLEADLGSVVQRERNSDDEDRGKVLLIRRAVYSGDLRKDAGAIATQLERGTRDVC